MKKTVIVNINGTIFHIDEDAFGKLNVYLEALHRYFDQQPEGREIVSDIEARIAELFQPRISEGKQSIVLEDVEEIIGILGKPEDIAGSDEETPDADKKHKEYERPYTKRLYRDTEEAVIGGVCSGLAAYFSIDPIIMRLIFIALFFAGGASILIYLILWIALPKAVTVAQKLEMRGKEVNVNNIGRTYQTYDFPRQPRTTTAERIFSGIGSIFRFIGKIIALVFGAFLILFSVFVIISLISAAFINTFFIDAPLSTGSVTLFEYLDPLIYPHDTALLMVIALLVVVIPLIGLIYAGLKILIRFKAKDRFAIFTLTIVWIVCVIIGVVMSFNVAGKFSNGSTTTETVALQAPKSGTIYLSIPDTLNESDFKWHEVAHSRMYIIDNRNGKKNLLGINEISIERGENSYPELEIFRKARGSNPDDAKSAAEKIKVSYSQTDSMLIIDPVFRLSDNSYWNLQDCNITLRLPVGMKIHFGNNVDNYLRDVDFHGNHWRYDLEGKTWQMSEDGLNLYSPFKTKTRSNFPESIIIKMQTVKGIKSQEIKMLRDSSRRLVLATDSGLFTYGVPEFKFLSTEDDSVKVRIDFQSIRNDISRNTRRIQNNHSIIRNNISRVKNWFNEVRYNAEFRGKTLFLEPLWYRSGQALSGIGSGKNRVSTDYKVRVNIYIPENTKVFLSQDLSNVLMPSDQRLLNKTYLVKQNDLYEMDKKYIVE